MYDFTYMRHLEQSNSQRQKQNGYQGAGKEERRRSYISIGTEFQFGVMKTLRMDDGDGCTTMYMYFTDLSILKHLKCFYIIYILPQLKNLGGISLLVHQLRLKALNAGHMGSIPGQGTRSYMPQLRPGTVIIYILKK